MSGEKPAEPADDARLIRSYVLGDLDQTAKEKFEERYFSDEALFNRFEEIEQELIEDYYLGHLTGAEGRRLKKQFRANRYRRENAQFFGELIRRFGPESVATLFPVRRRLVAALAVALGLVTASLVAMVVLNLRVHEKIQSRSTEVRLQLGASSVSRTGSPEDRAQHSNLQLRPDTLVVEITLKLRQPKERELYTAVLENTDGMVLESQYRLSVEHGTGQVRATLPAARLPQGSYVLRLTDSQEQTVESFPFSVLVE